MKALVYARRNLKELLSDKESLFFTILLPSFLLVLMVQINQGVMNVENFLVENFVPATIVFSYAFLTMFVGLLISKDRATSFLARMYVSPMKAHDYLIGYALPVMVLSLLQSTVLYVIGAFIGLPLTIGVLISLPFLMVVATLFISIGLLFGSTLKDSQIGPIASIVIQVVAFLSGMWFPLQLIGGAFQLIGEVLPFYHAVELIKVILDGTYLNLGLHLLVVIGYTLASSVTAVLLFKAKMKQ